MNSEPNVLAFCCELQRRGVTLLADATPDLLDLVQTEIQDTDLCFHDSIQWALLGGWHSGPEEAVDAALTEWLGVVYTFLNGLLGPDSCFPWSQCGVSADQRLALYFDVDDLQLNRNSDAMAALVAAASQPIAPDEEE